MLSKRVFDKHPHTPTGWYVYDQTDLPIGAQWVVAYGNRGYVQPTEIVGELLYARSFSLRLL